MRHGSLFSGIGGFDLAAEWMGWENVFHCEWNEFGKRVLKYYWPKSISYHDITKTDFAIHIGQIDVLSGGFPCQPFSLAGKRKGTEDDRHLWPEMLRAIREIQPAWVVGENVFGLVNWSGGLVFEQVQTDLEAEGYEVQSFILPACGIDAPHKRERVWIVANTNGTNCKTWTFGEILEQPNRQTTNGSRNVERSNQWQNFPTQSAICDGDDGLSTRLDNITFPKWRNESIKAGGNAVVPQVVHQIFKAIQAYETSLHHQQH